MTRRMIALGFVLLLTLTAGCGRGSAPSPGNRPLPAPQTTASNPSAPDSSTLIGEDKAKEIALEKAGIPADDVVFERVELDRDNGILHYEVEFSKDRTEYDADIKADDGTVISFETDYQD